MRAQFQRQPRRHRQKSMPFPWVRLVLALILTVLFLLGAALQILSSGNVISSYWLLITPPLIAVIALLIPLYQYLLPLPTEDTAPHTFQTHQPLATHPTTDRHLLSASTTPLWNVPYPHSPFFIGREALLTHLYDLLHDEKAAALTQAISGLGGIGKTQLAVEYAYRNRDTYQAILWTTATTYETLFTDFVALADLLDLPEKDSQNQTTTVHAVIYWLESHSQWLLIFDNAEDLELLRDFLPTGGKGHIILTTRSQATGAIAQPLEVTQLAPDDGAVLLLRRARIIPPNASLADASDENQSEARAIANLLDGFPLAIDQAGAYTERMRCSLSDYRERYQTAQATLLNERGPLFSIHPESVTTTFSLSFQKVQQVNPAAADLLRFFAFLSPEAIPIDLCREGAPELGKLLKHTATNPQRLDEALSILYSYSLVRRDATTNTLYIHRLVQAVIKDEMSAGTQRQWAERTVRAINRTFPAVEVEAWQRYRQLLPQVVVCMELIDQYQMNFSEATRLLNDAAHYMYEHAQYTEDEPLYQRALAIWEKRLPAWLRRGYRIIRWESIYTIHEDDPKHHSFMITAEIEAIKSGISIFEDTYKWTGQGKVEAPIVISPGQTLMGELISQSGWKYYYIHLGQTLNVGDKIEVKTIKELYDPENKFESFLAIVISQPIDHLTLKVVLPKNNSPSSITLTEWDIVGPTSNLIGAAFVKSTNINTARNFVNWGWRLIRFVTSFNEPSTRSMIGNFNKHSGEILWEIRSPTFGHRYAIRWKY